MTNSNKRRLFNPIYQSLFSEEKIAEAIRAVISETGATSMADMGKVMGAATKKLAGQADGKVVSEWVKKLLSGN